MRLHFQAYGQSGEAVIILHGLFGSLDNWASISRELGKEFRVFALDLRNHGRSPHAREMDYGILAADVAEFMSSQSLERSCLLGHSMGGKAAMELALSQAELVSKLVVVDIAPRAYQPGHRKMLEAMLAADFSKYKSRAAAEEALASAVPDAVVRRFLMKSVVHEPGGALRWRMDVRSIAENYDRLVRELAGGRQFNGPALFIRGARSRYITEQDAGEILRLFPRARIEEIPGADHWVHADAPQLLLQAVRKFFA